jgi:hypothetical protein
VGIVRKVLGPLSKYDKSLPYTYMAKVIIIDGDDELANYYFADTICGLVEHLDKNLVKPEEVQLWGCYLKKEISLDNDPLLTEDGKWLQRPELCRKLESHFQKTMDDRYKGHEAHSDCSFDDRNSEAY